MSYPDRFTPRPARELHNVYAYLTTGAKVLIAGGLSWDGAQDRWSFLDAVRRLADTPGEFIIALRVGEFDGIVKHFCVRSAEDPNWPDAQPNHDVIPVCG